MKEFDVYLECLKRHRMNPTQNVLIADLGEKILGHWVHGQLLRSYTVSTSKRPYSCLENSLGTPWGLHEVAAKHGDGAPAGMVFVGREATGACWHEREDKGPEQSCLVTTRILRLRGLETGLNAGPGIDSHDRYIYIHGTNHPGKFPENISAGCLLMKDAPLMDLFDQVPVATHVLLLK